MAVAIKAHGFKNIKIYNGGIKDWKKSGRRLESVETLSELTTPFITAEELLEKIKEANKGDCQDTNGQKLVTLIDIRSSFALKKKIGADHTRIQSNCPTIVALLDDFIDNKQLLKKIPRKGLVVIISETGNRDEYLIHYLKKYNYNNIVGLEFGMRGWLISRYPTDSVGPKI
jgi:rhodanese-related sulfurtransferase